MPRKHRDVRSGLESKGFAVDQQRHHIVLVYEDLEGRTTTARTLISHGAGGNEIRDALLGQMARQVGLTRVDFRRLVDCPMSRKEFDTVIAKRDN
jgi:hypothetical protein